MNRAFKTLVNILLWAGIVFAIHNMITWKDSIKNPENDEFVAHLAVELEVEKHEITQSQFNRKYK